MSGLSLPGTLSITQTTISEVVAIEDSFTLQELQTNRLTNYSSQAFTYYIKIFDDLNAKCNFQGAGSGDNADDAWGMSALSYTDASSNAVSINLPTRSDMDVAAGIISYNNGAVSTDLNVELTLNLDNQGVLTASAEMASFADVATTEDEDLTKAQHVYWPIDKANSGTQYGTSPPSAPTDSAADILSDDFNKADLDNHYATELASLVSTYNNLNVVSSWSLSVSAVTQETNSLVSKYARSLTDLATGAVKSAATGASDVFITYDQVVAATPAAYSVSILDGASIPVSQLIAADNVYGVVKHAAA